MAAMLICTTLALALVLLLRTPARRAFGAGPAFVLWLLPPLLAALPWLPSWWPMDSVAPTLRVVPAALAHATPATWTGETSGWLASLWLAGATIGLLRLILHYLRLIRRSHRLPAEMLSLLQDDLDGIDPRRLRLHPAGPAVLWAPRSLLLLPPDFLQRFTAIERRLILRHEQMHLRRGDALWSLLAEGAAALLWFHPLAWLARGRFRLDQELACDERVLRQWPQDTAGYAHTLLRSTGADALPVLIPWLDPSQLKERLTMIQNPVHNKVHRRAGLAALIVLMAGVACVAQAAVQAGADHSAAADTAYNAQYPPRYPADAVKNQQSGVVILDVTVGTDGKPLAVQVNPATQAVLSLIQTASEAAMHWRYAPAVKDGKPVKSSIRVPVRFEIEPAPPSGASTAVSAT